ncbi:MAG: hypothetical protein QNJ97_16360 [Myxococcota bacterium]|nr:hypothetical protein [Myxococcota bacterium]
MKIYFSLILLLLAFGFYSQEASADAGDAPIQYQLALAARAKGDEAAAYPLFKATCMASDGMADACLAWAELAEAKGIKEDVKRALGSAVILAPEDIRARAALAAFLLKKQDYEWAIEHLLQAIPNATADADRALLRYYYAYALFKTGEDDAALEHFTLARPDLPQHLLQRCDYYEAIIAKRQGRQPQGVALLKTAQTGQDDAWAGAATDVLESWSAFRKSEGVSGRVSGSLGINTHPSSAFLDAVETDAEPVLQSVFRGDLIYGKNLKKGALQAIVTAYREQNWHEFEDKKKNPSSGGATDVQEASLSDEFSPQDFNTTVFIGQAAYLAKTWGNIFEHELKIGLDGELQYLDHPPIKDDLGHFYREEDPFRLISWAVGGKIWWSFARTRDALYSIRLKIEGRPNYIDRDRSTSRYRLRLHHTRYFHNREFQLKITAGARYDRSYHDPKVIKYDRFLPELETALRWRTPVPRLTALISGKLKYNWYMNARQNQKNSFRPQYVDVDLTTDMDTIHTEGMDEALIETIQALQANYEANQELLADLLNAYFEKEYYDLTRRDLEWEVGGELQVAAWKGAEVALTYKHHQRSSNIDDAPAPRWLESTEQTDPVTGETSHIQVVNGLAAPRYSYEQDVVMLELRQRF